MEQRTTEGGIVRVLIIGYGSAGRRHAANARSLGHEVGVQDTDSERCWDAAADGYVMPDDDWLVEVDAVVVATPASQHVQAMRDWWATPMLVEKPLATSVSEVEHFKLVHPSHDVFVGYNWRYHQEVRGFRTRFRRADDLLLTCGSDMATWPGRSYAEPLLEMSHEIDLLRWWRAPVEPELVACQTWSDCDGVSLRFSGGDEVRLRWNVPATRGIFATEGGRERRLWPSFTGAVIEQSYREELVAFCQFVSDGVNRGHCDLDGGLAVLRICEQAKVMAVVSA
jgi:predicted dehydrogenase